MNMEQSIWAIALLVFTRQDQAIALKIIDRMWRSLCLTQQYPSKADYFGVGRSSYDVISAFPERPQR
ncbi:hypothetical protein Nos7524_1281 [Nostoc sp. PCC 7524]|nr:hypothetical protein Nos7524_1281 [Nostoc sp. PCC 7524]